MGWFTRRPQQDPGSRELAVVDAQVSTAAEGVRSPVPSNPVPPSVRAIADWSWRLLIIVAAIAVAIVVLIQLKTVVVPIMVAVLVASLLMPGVVWMQGKLRFPRALAVVATLIVALAAVGGLLTLAGTSIASGISDLGARAFVGLEEGLGWLSTGPLGLSPVTIDQWVGQIREQLQANADRILTGALSVTTSVGHIVAGALIALFCLFFFLKDGRVIWSWVVGLFPKSAREKIDGAGLRGWMSLGTYARTQIMVAFIDGVGIGLGAWLLGVPLALPLGVLVFIGSFIPIIGAITTGSIAIAVALVDQGVLRAGLMLLVVLAVQQIESNLLQPILMSKALSLHPVAVLLAVAAGTIVGGIVGALFAVPLIAVSNTVLLYLNGRDSVSSTQRRMLDLTIRGRARA